MSRKVLTDKAQEVMDSNNNCCFNCTHFKIKWDKENSIIPQNILQYRALKARCINPLAIREDVCKENPVRLQSLLNRDQIPVARKDCEYFELG